jgi:hypothetical protein
MLALGLPDRKVGSALIGENLVSGFNEHLRYQPRDWRRDPDLSGDQLNPARRHSLSAFLIGAIGTGCAGRLLRGERERGDPD